MADISAPIPPRGARYALAPRLGRLTWRRLEWWCVGLALTLQSGAFFPLWLMGPDGDLNDAQKARLRLVAVPAYLISIMLLWPHWAVIVQAVRRNLLLVALMVLPFVSMAWSISGSLTLRRAVGLVLSMLLGYLLAIRFTPRQLLLLIAMVLAVCIGASLVVAAAMPRLGFMPGESTMRGVFTHKNGLGQIACLAVVMAAAMIWDSDRRLHRFGLVMFGPSALCLVMSQSATALLAAAVALAMAAFHVPLARRAGLPRTVLVLISLQFVALVLLWLDTELLSFLRALGKDATLTGRVPLWAEVDRDINARLLTGYGFAAFWSDNNPEAWRIWGQIGWQAPNAHNAWRESLLDFGLIGPVLLGTILGRAVWQVSVLHCAAPRAGWLWLNAFLALVLTISLTESSVMGQNELMWILTTAIVLMAGLHRPDPSRRAQTRLRP